MRRVLLIPFLAAACTAPEPLNPAEPETVESELEMPVIPVPEAPIAQAPADPELLKGEDETAVAVVEDGSAPEVEIVGGESLGLYAQWAGITAETIAERNKITLRSKLQIGQKIIVPVQGAAADKFRAQRATFIAGRLQRFLEKRGGLVKVSDVTVRRGQSLWHIAQRNGKLPLWVIQHYNPGRNLDKLAVGDVVKVPITSAQTTAAR